MFTDTTLSTRAIRALDKKIPDFQSTVPRKRPYRKITIAIVLSAMFVAFADISAGHAEIVISMGESVVILAQADPSGAKDGQDLPPREAIDACAKQPADAKCSFTGREGGTVSGTCRSPIADAPAACVPANMPKKG